MSVKETVPPSSVTEILETTVREILRQDQAFTNGGPDTNTNPSSAADISKSQAGRIMCRKQSCGKPNALQLGVVDLWGGGRKGG
jgi:hypothetical protein